MDHAEDAVKAMLDLAEVQRLRSRAEEACRSYLRSADTRSDLDRLECDDIRVVFERCALVFDHARLGYPFIETRLGLYSAESDASFVDGLRSLGHYRLITSLDGTEDDDYFVLHDAERRT